MITRPTVLVLGAGASRPYEFPSAFEMIDQICREVSGPGPVTETLLRCGFIDSQVEEFLHRVKNSGRYSIDAFLQRYGADQNLRLMGKVAIVAQLKEDDGVLRTRQESEDWLRYLIARMSPPKSRGFEDNKLQVVTFNFDRSLERRLFLMLRNSYPIDDVEAARLAQAFPILHVHGQLGVPAWFSSGDPSARDFVPPSTPEDIRACAEQIRLVDDEIAPATIERVRSMLQMAERICFLGFSFHSDNMDRLGADQRLGNKTLFGTRHQMSDAAVGTVYRRLSSPRRDYLLNRTARGFFDVVDLFD